VQRRQIGAVAVVVGAIAVLVALLADTLGIGGNEDTFGWKQVMLLAVGLVVAAGGLLAIMRATGDQRPSP
jgi:NADH:ubiquinone oxidoreductase subunit 6 (subunit J)